MKFIQNSFILSFKCKRCVNNIQVTLPPENSDCTCDFSQWYHSSVNKGIPDDILLNAWDITKNVSFIFHQRSAQQEVVPDPKPPKKNKKDKRLPDDDGDYTEPESNDDANDEDYE